MKFISCLLVFVMALSTVQVRAESALTFRQVWSEFNARVVTLKGHGKYEKIFGIVGLDGSLVLLGTGFLMDKGFKIVLGQEIFFYGMVAIFSGLSLMGSGAAIDLVWPRRRYYHTNSEPFKTEGGLEKFLALPLEEQFKIANDDPELMHGLLELQRQLKKF